MEEKYEKFSNNFSINSNCMELFPCQHMVILNGVKSLMYSVEIKEYLESLEIVIINNTLTTMKLYVCDDIAPIIISYLPSIVPSHFKNARYYEE